MHQQARTILQPAGETIGQEGKEGLFNEDSGDPVSTNLLSLVTSNISLKYGASGALGYLPMGLQGPAMIGRGNPVSLF